LWDVQRIIPQLDRIATTLTAAQDDYLFKPISIPAPLGTWRREKAGGVAYLHAENVVARQRDKPRELGLHRLIAITNLPLRDTDTLNLYAWDEDPKGEISLFSTYKLIENIRPPLSVERMVANLVAGVVGSLIPHVSGRKNCPFYFNEERNVQYVAGPLVLCARCRRLLTKKAKDVKVIDKLLQACA
jgi:hypothetical protein